MSSSLPLYVHAMIARYKRKIASLKQSVAYFQTRSQILERIIANRDPSLLPPAGVAAQARYQHEHSIETSMTAMFPETFGHFVVSSLRRNMDREPQGRRWETSVLMLAYVLRNLGARSYDYLRMFLPLPCKQTLGNHFQMQFEGWKMALVNLSGIKGICQLFRRRHDIHDDLLIDVVIAVDAMSMEQVQEGNFGAKSGDNHVFLFHMLPLSCEYKPVPIHLLTQNSGNAGEAVKQTLLDIAARLHDAHFIVRCVATDGDHGYQELHTAMFDSWWPQFCSKGVEGALQAVKECTRPIIADFLHLLKNARSRIINNRVSLSPCGADAFSAAELNDVLLLGPSLTDQSAKGRMRDSYALEIFTLGNFSRLISQNKYHMAFYLLPYCLWSEVFRNPYLSVQLRRELLVRIADVFALHLFVVNHLDGDLVSENKKPGIPQYFCSSTHAVRVLNTVMQMLVEMDRNIDNLALDRLGTHVVECLFGQIRLLCGYKHDWTRILRSFSRVMFINDLCTLLGHPIVPRERDNVAGVKIRGESHTIYIDPVECPTRQIYETVLALIEHNQNPESVPTELVQQMLGDIQPFLAYIEAFRTQCELRGVHTEKLTHGTAISNSTIMARLISFTHRRNREAHDDNPEATAISPETVSAFMELSQVRNE